MRKILLLGLCIILSINAQSQKKYNVLWLVLEDQSAQFFPMYGDSTIDLPTLESIASESLIFDNAFANVPVCAPARSTIILGMHPISTATHNMRTFNAYNAKNQPSINVPSYTPVMPKGVIEFPKYLRSAGYYCTNNAKEDYNMKITDGVWDESSNTANWKSRSGTQPFFSIFNITNCHESGLWKFTDDELLVNPDEVSVPPYFPDDSIIRHDLAVNYSNLSRSDDQIKVIIEQLKEDGLYDDTYIFFYGDHGGPFPRHKRSLRDSGLKVPFFVKLPKDMNKGVARKEEMISFLDLAPTMLSIAGIEKPENMQGRAFLGQYVSPEFDYIFASSDRYDAVYERSRAVRSGKYKLIRNYRSDLPYALPIAYRTQVPMMKRLRKLSNEGKLKGPSALWMRESKDSLEFFDLHSDPFELNNLANNPFYESEIELHKAALEQWQIECDDQGNYDESKLIEKWKKQRASLVLDAPKLQFVDDEVQASNPNELGNIVYQRKGDSKWFPYHKHLVKKEDLMFKVVHIGLQDSEVVTF